LFASGNLVLMMFYGIVDYATSYATLLLHNERKKSRFDNELRNVLDKQAGGVQGYIAGTSWWFSPMVVLKIHTHRQRNFYLPPLVSKKSSNYMAT
jgi:hypothetical protein